VLERSRFDSEMRDLIVSPSPSTRRVAELAWPGERENGKTSTAAPRLMDRENQPPADTLYVRIPLGVETLERELTAIYLPSSVKVANAIDVILYLHGYKTFAPGTHTSIRQYLKHKYWPLREGLEATGRRFVLVAPTLGPKAQYGKLVSKGLDWYLGQVTAALVAHAGYDAPPSVRRLILAAHSAGGEPMRQLALSKAAHAAAITECWGFDCLYNSSNKDPNKRLDPKQWATWAKAHPSSRLYVHFQCSTCRLSRELAAKRLANVSVECSLAPDPGGHFNVPNFHWKDRIQATAAPP
jgi:hypothetical protein